MVTSLVTGAEGFTGRYLVRALSAKGHQVHGLTRAWSAEPGLLACDLTDPAAVSTIVKQMRPDYVVHLAALSFVGDADAEAFYRVNLFGTLNLLSALESNDSPAQKIVIASSANVYGAPNGKAIDEGTCPAPRNHYANSKLAMEHMVRTWFDRLPIIVTRPFNYTGPGQDERFLVPKIIGHFRRREMSIPLGNLEVRRDFSDVRDVVAAYIALLQCDAHSETVNICRGEAVALREILAIAGELAGYEIQVELEPSLVRHNEIPVLHGSNAKLRQLIGMTPQIPLEHTLREMYLA